MRKGSKAFASGVGLVALATAVAACGGSSSSSGSSGKSSGGSTSLSSGTQGINPGSGTPKSGGTLNMLGQGDVDYIDYNISYYSIGQLAQRLYQRYLYNYPAVPGKTTTVAPDLATAAPVVSNGGKTYSVTIRTGAMWNTTPARQVTAADALRGIERSCNGVQPFGGLPDFESLIVGYSDFCTGFAKATTPAAMKSYLASHSPSGVKVSGQTISYTLVHPASYFPGQLDAGRLRPGADRVAELRARERRGAAARDLRRAVPDPELHPGAADHVRPQPGLEGQLGPDPQGLRQQDRGQRDR